MIVKYLKAKGFKIFYLQNITDIDDKIIKRAKEKKISPQKLARNFEKIYFKDMKNLGIDSVTKYARATDHIKEIISQIKRLLIKGIAYKIQDGIYYDISKFKDYGRLSRRTVLQAEDAISRIDEAKEKRNRGDFCLWKYAKSLSSPKARSIRKGTSEYEPVWQGPFGPGRPGWHIEDTSITEKYFGPQYDLHGGGRDLIFPHHEAEIAQMEAISGKKPMVKYWLHVGFLTIGEKKMAKSLGNFITIRDFLKKHSPRLLRYLLLKVHYRSSLNYSEKLVFQAKKELERIDEFIEKLKGLQTSFQLSNDRSKSGQNLDSKRSIVKALVFRVKKQFEKTMEDDFNTPRALAQIFQLVNKGNTLLAQDKLSPGEARQILRFLRKIDKIFNFLFWQKPRKKKIPKEILKLVDLREKYRKQKNWGKADEIRKKIKRMGYWIEDLKEGPKIKKLG
jgi:cysteinyl-tRNA synthetase